MRYDYHSGEEKAERLNDLHDEMLAITTIQSLMLLLFCSGLSFYFPMQTWFWHVAAGWIILESIITVKIKLSALRALRQ